MDKKWISFSDKNPNPNPNPLFLTVDLEMMSLNIDIILLLFTLDKHDFCKPKIPNLCVKIEKFLVVTFVHSVTTTSKFASLGLLLKGGEKGTWKITKLKWSYLMKYWSYYNIR